MTFEEVDRSFADLRRLRQEGALSNDEFLAELDRISVNDSEGRVWKKEPSGRWTFQSDGQWIAIEGAPDKPEPASPVVVDTTARPSAVPTGGLAVLLYILSFVIPLVGVIIWFLYRNKGEEARRLGKIALIAAAAGLVFWLVM